MSSAAGTDDRRFDRTIAAIDEINAGDPNTIEFAGETTPKEIVHALRMTHWVRYLDPDAGVAQLLAARGHHIARWTVARSDYPDGRDGYLRWRRERSAHHGELVGGILAEAGYPEQLISRVRAIMAKRGRTSDPQVQTHEDALCLVFVETQLGDLARRLGADKTIDVLEKSVRKMSAAGVDAAATIELGPDEAELLAAAVARGGARS